MIKKILVMFIVFVTTLITFGSCSNKIRNIEEIEITEINHLSNSEKYRLYANKEVVDLSKIEKINELTELTIENSKILNFDKMSNSKNLVKLTIKNSEIEKSDRNKQNIWNLENLREIELINVKGIEDLNIILNSKKLNTVIVRGLELEKIGKLETEELLYVDLRNNKLEDIEFLKNNKLIDTLLLDNNNIDKIDISLFLKLKFFSNSKTESLMEEIEDVGREKAEIIIEKVNNIVDMKEISKFKDLKKLVISNVIIENIEHLYELKKLEKLELSNVTILNSKVDVNKTEGKFFELKEFDIGDNTDFKNLNIVKNSKKLETININNTSRIEDISVLKDFNNLKEVYLSNNLIKNITDLKKLKNIKKLTIDNNFIENIDVLENMKELEFLSVSKNKIKNFRVIKKLEKLRYLGFDVINSKEEVKDILPNKLYEEGKIDNSEVYNGELTGIYIE